ncbi:MAG: nucleoside-diphosphate kinase [Lysobacterales bacterium]|jgi:nucleoside-diphosphate kinase
MKQSVLVIIKPDGMSKGLVGNILNKFSAARLEVIGMKSVKASKEMAEEHYQQLKDMDFFDELIDYLTGKLHAHSHLVAIVYNGEDAIKKCRTIAGVTNPEEADPLSLRGAFGRIKTNGLFENVVHVSSDDEEAQREISLWFTPEELSADIYESKIASVERKVWA